MKISEAIEQLKDLKKDRECFLRKDEPDSEFAKDIEAIDAVIDAIHAMSITEPKNTGDTVIYEQDYVHSLGIFEGSIIDGSIKLVPNKKFNWNSYSNPHAPEDVFRYLTLEEIAEQYSAMDGTISPLLTVIYESPLGGVIYQFGNYADHKWYKIGELKGYA